MPTSNFRQSVIALVLVALLGAPLTAAAAPHGGFRLQDSYSDAVAWLWSVLAGRWSKNGCSIDPFGRCQSNSKEGCRIDPNGRCVTNSLQGTDNGCSIDPDGRCVTDSMQDTDNGCRIDPNGRCVADPDETSKNGCSIDPNGRCY